jgi:hypothetical protein
MRYSTSFIHSCDVYFILSCDIEQGLSNSHGK